MHCIFLVLFLCFFISPAEADPAPIAVAIEDLTIGSGAEASSGQVVTIHYKAWTLRKDGKRVMFDNSYDRRKAYVFRLGHELVIPGLEQGIIGMKVGGLRRLQVPAHLGFGERGAGAAVPPNKDLIFEVELLNVEN